jgi:hypothetical protein
LGLKSFLIACFRVFLFFEFVLIAFAFAISVLFVLLGMILVRLVKEERKAQELLILQSQVKDLILEHLLLGQEQFHEELLRKAKQLILLSLSILILIIWLPFHLHEELLILSQILKLLQE